MVRRILLFTGIFILGSVILGFALRDALLDRILHEKLELAAERLGATITYRDASFAGLSTFKISDLCVLPPYGDTLLGVQQVQVHVKPLSMLAMKLRFSKLQISGLSVHLRRQGLESNYLFLLQRPVDTALPADTSASTASYSAAIGRLFRAVFRYTPENVSLSDFLVDAMIDHHSFDFRLDRLIMEDSHFDAFLKVTDDGIQNIWKVHGEVNPADENIEFSLGSPGDSLVKIPYIRQRWGLLFAFDSLRLRLHYNELPGEITQLRGEARAWQQVINHERISPEDVVLENGETNFILNISKTWAEVDSVSKINYNNQSFSLFARYDKLPEARYRLKINKPDFSAQEFFSSLPRGLFSNLAGIRVKGRLGFRLNFDYSRNEPDSLVFDAKLTSQNFSIEKYGETNFTYINEPFLYTAYEKGAPVRSFMVGSENPDFRRIDQIPLYLRYAIMTSEDGSFYYHAGFLPDAIRESIITNIKEKRFARGGSTISMQLVKNVFLNRNKTITRKVEELLITWLIESRHLSDKDRMFEVYRLAATRSWRFRRRKLFATTKLDTKHKASFNH